MGLWVLEPKRHQKVPGTVHVERLTEEQRRLTAYLKHGAGRNEDVILVPQPSDSVNDPLNWSETSKFFHSIFLSLGTGLASGTIYFLNPSHGKMAHQIKTTVTTLSRTVAVLMLCMGISSVLSSPLARIYGKRPIFLVSGIVAIIGYSLVLSHPKDINYIYAGRALWGLGTSALEYLVSASVGDLFFVHQRGFHLAIWHACLAAGSSLGQVIASQITQRQGYVWAFRYAIIIWSAYTILLFFLVPETTYNRPSRYDTDVLELLAGETDLPLTQNPVEKPFSDKNASFTYANDAVSDEGAAGSQERKKTYLQQLKVYNGRFSEENYCRSLLSPFATYLLPGVAWAAYTYGCTVAFSAGFSVSLSQIFSAPPYNFSTSAIGLTVLSQFVAFLLGNFVPGPIADWIVKYMSKRNNGVYEPEFRNILCIPALITGLIGYWGFALSIRYKAHWFAPVFFFGLSSFSGSITSLVSNTYLLDCHRKYAQNAYAAVTLVKGIMTFAIAFFINDWVIKHGALEVFFVLGALQATGCLWGLVLYVYGKRLRLWVHNSPIIQSILRQSGNK